MIRILDGSMRLAFFSLYLLVSALVTATVHTLSLNYELGQLERTGAVRFEQARDRLLGQLTSFRQLPNTLARHPDVLWAVRQDEPSDDLNEMLLNTALRAGAFEIDILRADGSLFASSAARLRPPEAPGLRPARRRPDVAAALNGRLGFFHQIEAASAPRAFLFARGIKGLNGKTIGAVVVRVDVSTLEFEWRVDEEAIAFFDRNLVAFVTNRPALAMRRDIQAATLPVDEESYRVDQVQPFYDYTERGFFGRRILSFDNAPSLPAEALVLQKHVPHLDMTALVFLSTDAPASIAWLQALLVGAFLGLIGLSLVAFDQRRRRLLERLAVEESANVRLEARVEARTAELRATQGQLVQASKLTALGQMSANISHELNQPLAAIRNYAENAQKLITRGREGDATENLDQITSQIERITRIVKNLRSFARKEDEEITRVDLVTSTRDALELSNARFEKQAVTLHWTPPDGPIWVTGGDVRLQQVIVNLLTNALDAMEGQRDQALWVSITGAKDSVALTLRDNGDGLADADRLFEPFYTTKDIGASKGLGLGLAISHGIIGSFGGELTGRNHPDGGAEFTISLPRAETQWPTRF